MKPPCLRSWSITPAGDVPESPGPRWPRGKPQEAWARVPAGSPCESAPVIRTLSPVKEQPGHIDQRELACILHEQWGLAPGRLCHLPVGFGDHHWELTGA